MSERERAEAEIFALRKKIDLYLLAGDSDEVNRLQIEIADLQKRFGATSGARRKINDRGNEAGSEPGD